MPSNLELNFEFSPRSSGSNLGSERTELHHYLGMCDQQEDLRKKRSNSQDAYSSNYRVWGTRRKMVSLQINFCGVLQKNVKDEKTNPNRKTPADFTG